MRMNEQTHVHMDVRTNSVLQATRYSFPDSSSNQDSKQPVLKCRYIIASIGFLILLILSINRTVMSVAIVAMVNNTAIKHLSEVKSESCANLIMNATDDESFYSSKNEGVFIWSPQVQGYVLGSYFVGYVITQIPGGLLGERYGCKWLLFSASLITGLVTLLIPPISRLSDYALIGFQTMRGLAQGFVQPSIAILASNWFPKKERGFLFTFMGSATSLGTAFGSIFTGYLCALPGGWTYSFYAVGSFGIALSVAILFLVAENPNAHRSISKAELHFILKNQENSLNKKRPKRQWSRMLTSIPVYAAVMGFFGHVWSLSQFWTVHSIFLGTILHYPIAENGILTAMPFLVQFLFNQIAAWISFYMQKNDVASVDFLRKFWTFLSGLGFSVCLLGIYFAGCHRTLTVSLSILSMGLNGAGECGIYAVAADMTPTFAGSLHAFLGTIGCTTTFIVPVIVGYLTDKMQTIDQWNKVFLISIGVVMLCKTFFVIFGSAEIQPWNFVEEIIQQKDEEMTENDKKNDGRDIHKEKTCF